LNNSSSRKSGNARRADSARTLSLRGENDRYSRPHETPEELPLFARPPFNALAMRPPLLEPGDLEAYCVFESLSEDEYRLELVSALLDDRWTLADGGPSDIDDEAEIEARLDLASYLANDVWTIDDGAAESLLLEEEGAV
jgi:hypothetical protein